MKWGARISDAEYGDGLEIDGRGRDRGSVSPCLLKKGRAVSETGSVWGVWLSSGALVSAGSHRRKTSGAAHGQMSWEHS